MSAETALRALLVADSAVAALVGNRIAADRIDQDKARPFVVYSRTASQPLASIDGSVLATLVSIDVECWADTRLTADQLADAVTAAVRGVPTQTVQGRSSGYEQNLDLELVVLNVEWWE